MLRNGDAPSYRALGLNKSGVQSCHGEPPTRISCISRWSFPGLRHNMGTTQQLTTEMDCCGGAGPHGLYKHALTACLTVEMS